MFYVRSKAKSDGALSAHAEAYETVEDARDAARLIEAQGYDSAWIVDEDDWEVELPSSH